MQLKEAIEILETRQKWLLRRMKQEGLTTPSYVRSEEGALRTVLGRIKMLPALDAVAKLSESWRQHVDPGDRRRDHYEDAAAELDLTLKKFGVVLQSKRKAI